MADQTTLAGALSALIGKQNFAILGLKNAGQRETAVLDQVQQNFGGKIASNDVIAKSVNDRNLPRGSLVDIRV